MKRKEKEKQEKEQKRKSSNDRGYDIRVNPNSHAGGWFSPHPPKKRKSRTAQREVFRIVWHVKLELKEIRRQLLRSSIENVHLECQDWVTLVGFNMQKKKLFDDCAD